jgi:DNA-directed RNA polymerase specialized sigma54-like protein
MSGKAKKQREKTYKSVQEHLMFQLIPQPSLKEQQPTVHIIVDQLIVDKLYFHRDSCT